MIPLEMDQADFWCPTNLIQIRTHIALIFNNTDAHSIVHYLSSPSRQSMYVFYDHGNNNKSKHWSYGCIYELPNMFVYQLTIQAQKQFRGKKEESFSLKSHHHFFVLTSQWDGGVMKNNLIFFPLSLFSFFPLTGDRVKHLKNIQEVN